jgi:hypothetical protein
MEDLMKSLLLGALALSLAGSSLACTQDGTQGIVEENSLNIRVGEGNRSITEADFNAAIDKVSAVYAPIVKEKGGNLKVERKWTDGTVNAYAQRQGSTYMVSMFGGLARHQTITVDGFTLVVCHEIGHHIGGAPVKSGSWASNEGQADYWGSMKCLRRTWEKDNNEEIVAGMEVPELVAKSCTAQFTNANEIAICERAAMAGLSLANLFKVLSNLPKAPDFSTPDPKIVTATNHNHPASQCRLDTYYQGGLCNAPLDNDVSNSDANQGVCSQKNGDQMGLRPLCWYKPAL